MTKEEREAARARCEAATEGPWVAHCDDHYDEHVHDGDAVIAIMHGFCDDEPRRLNAEFIAHARTDIPVALDALDAMEGRVETIRIERNIWEQRCMGALKQMEGIFDDFKSEQSRAETAEADRDRWRARAEAMEREATGGTLAPHTKEAT